MGYHEYMGDRNLLKLGAKISYLRKKNGMSQMDLSLKTGLTTRTISRIECGEDDPKYTTLEKIAKAMNTDVESLFDFKL